MVECYEEGREPDTLDCLAFHVDRLSRILLAMDVPDEVLEAVGMAHSLIAELNSACRTPNMCGYVPTVVCENVRGRPRLELKQEQLEYLLKLGFKCPKVAEVLGVSLSTVRRRMSECGLSVTALYSQVTDQELDEIVSEIKHDFPNCGSRLMYGHLVGRGHRVSHARICESLHRVDPEGVTVRWTSAVQRRKYSVFSPLSLWHLDGNHKLIRCLCGEHS